MGKLNQGLAFVVGINQSYGHMETYTLVVKYESQNKLWSKKIQLNNYCSSIFEIAYKSQLYTTHVILVVYE